MKRRQLLIGAAGTTLGAMTGGLISYAASDYYLQPDDWSVYFKHEADLDSATKAMDARGTVVRKHIGDLTPTEVEKFKAAVGVMRARSQVNPMDPTGWTAQALQHALYCSSAVRNLQVHWSWYFLPWHRGYLWSVERLLAAAIGDKDFALPYWDWTRRPFIDPAYIGFGNPLHDQTRFYTGSDQIPGDFLDIEGAMSAPHFYQFGGYPYPKGPGQLIEGVMEQSFHNNVHNWMGGNMGAFATAAFDPIFTGHHGNIDRAWSAWLLDESHEMPDSEEWLNTEFTYPGPTGDLVRLSVRDLLDTRDIGYQFADLDFRQAPIEPPALGNRATRFAVKADDGERAQIATQMKSGRRYGLLRFGRVNVSLHPLCVRAFIGVPNETPYFIATFTILPVQTGGVGSLNTNVTMQVALPPSLAEMISSNKPLEVYMEPVQLRGREIPKEPIRLEDVVLLTNDNPRRV